MATVEPVGERPACVDDELFPFRIASVCGSRRRNVSQLLAATEERAEVWIADATRRQTADLRVAVRPRR